MTRTFEEYLQDIHEKSYHGTDDFEAWLGCMDIDDIMKYADEFAKKAFEDGRDIGMKRVREVDMKNKKINKLDINLFPESVSEEEYKKARNKYIADYTEYEQGNFFSSGRDVLRPDVGESRWNEMYPEGYRTWASRRRGLNSYGQQSVIDKINEIIDAMNLRLNQ